MVDKFAKEKRSEVMSKIRSKSGLDRKVHNWLCAKHVRHRMHPRVEGSPDVWLEDSDAYVFLDSCFFHQCPRHYREPKSSFLGVDWRAKIARNVERDRRVDRRLRRRGFRVLRIWEHDVERKPRKVRRLLLETYREANS